MSLLFSGKSSVTLWIQQSVCDALLSQPAPGNTVQQSNRPKLAQVIGRDSQSLRLSDGQAEIQAFVDCQNKSNNNNSNSSDSLPAVGSAVRINDWHVATTTEDHDKSTNSICLVIKGGVDVLGGLGMPIHGRPENIHRLVDVRRALGALSVRLSERLPVYRRTTLFRGRNGTHGAGNVSTMAQQNAKSNCQANNVAAATDNNGNLPIENVAAFLQQQKNSSSSPTRHHHHHNSTARRTFPVGNVESLLQNKESMRLLSHTYHHHGDDEKKVRNGFRGYNMMGNGVAFVTEDPAHIKNLIVSIQKEQAGKKSNAHRSGPEKRTNTTTTKKQRQQSGEQEKMAVDEASAQQINAPIVNDSHYTQKDDSSSESAEEQGIGDMLLPPTPTKKPALSQDGIITSPRQEPEQDDTRAAATQKSSNQNKEMEDPITSDEEFTLKYVHLDQRRSNASPSEGVDDEDEFLETQDPEMFETQPLTQMVKTKPFLHYVGIFDGNKDEEGVDDENDDEMEQTSVVATAIESTLERWVRIAHEAPKQVRPLEVGMLGGDTLRSLLIKKRRTPSTF